MASLGQLVIELAANTARLQGDLGKAVGIAEKAAGKIKSAFKFAGGGLIGAALVGTVKQSIQFGDSIAKAASKAGVGAKAMSELAYAAKLADVEIASLSTAIKKMQVSLSEAGTGAKGPLQALSALGLSIGQIQKLKPDAQFEMLAQRISELTDPADRARAATELFGKAGADLLPLFEQGAAGIRKAREEAQKLGLSFSDDQISKLATADDAIKRLDASWQGFATTLTAKVAPALSNVLDRLSGGDSRSNEQKSRDLEDELAWRVPLAARLMPGSPDRVRNDQRIADLENRRNEITRDRISQGATIGAGSRGQGTRASRAAGYAAADAATAAREAADKEVEIEAKKYQELLELHDRMLTEESEMVSEAMDEEFETFLKHEERQAEVAREKHEEMEALQREQAERRQKDTERLGELLDDQLMDAFRRSKEGWKDMLRYWATQLAMSGLSKLFGGGGGTTLGGSLAGMFKGGGAGFAQGEWDWLGKIGGGTGNIFSGMGSIFGFAKGGRPAPGVPYWVGEEGPELRVDGAGSIIPNHAIGGGMSFAPVINIDARGATMELTRALPKILRDNNDALEAQIVQRLRKRHYGPI